jgi:hypothetical protein
MKFKLSILLFLLTLGSFAQNKQVVFDVDPRGYQIAKVLPFKLAEHGDTTLMLEARYGLENNQERFRFIFTVSHEGSMFYKTADHTTLTFKGENASGTLESLEPLKFEVNTLEYHFVFTAGDLGYEDNDISLQRMGGIRAITIHQLPEMDMIFTLAEEQYGFLKDLQNSLRISYRKGDTTGGSVIRGSFGNEKSSRNTKSRSNRGNR